MKMIHIFIKYRVLSTGYLVTNPGSVLRTLYSVLEKPEVSRG
jgi:hypothetical protein